MKNFRKQLVEKYKNPIPRKLRTETILAANRKLAVNRKLVGFVNDGKLRVVLDTNIIINSLKKEENQVRDDCRKIIDLWKTGAFALGMNDILFEEYKLTGDALAKKAFIDVTLFNTLMVLVKEKACFCRMLISKKHFRSYKDDHLFDGLTADYLVSEDRKDIVCRKVFLAQTSYGKIVTASDFLSDLLS